MKVKNIKYLLIPCLIALPLSSYCQTTNMAYTYGTTNQQKTTPADKQGIFAGESFDHYIYSTSSPNVISKYWQFSIDGQCLLGPKPAEVDLYVDDNGSAASAAAKAKIFQIKPEAYVCEHLDPGDAWNTDFISCSDKVGGYYALIEMGGGGNPAGRHFKSCL